MAELRLRSGDATVRVAQLRKLGENGDPKATRLLLAALGDREEKVRFAAYDAIVALGPDVRPELLAALNSNAPQIRCAAAAALGELMDIDAAPRLSELICDPDATVRAAVCEALGKLGDRKRLVHLRLALEDSSPHVRRFAAEALGRMPDSASLGMLLVLLRDPEQPVQRAAAEALYVSASRGMDAESQMTSVLAVQEWLLTRRQEWMEFDPALAELQQKTAALAQSLLRRGKEVVDACLAFVQHDQPYLKLWCLQAMTQIGDGRSVPVLLAHANHSDPSIAHAAHQAVVAVGRRGYLRHVEGGLKHAQADIRMAAINALAECGRLSSIPPLQSARRDEDQRIKSAALEAIRRIQRQAAQSSWQQMQENSVHELRDVARRAFGTGNERVPRRVIRSCDLGRNSSELSLDMPSQNQQQSKGT